MPNPKKQKKKPKGQFVPANYAAPAAKADTRKYGLDYGRFDAVESDDSDKERAAVAPRAGLRAAEAPASPSKSKPQNPEDLERELMSHVSGLSAREALSAARAAEADEPSGIEHRWSLCYGLRNDVAGIARS